MKFEFSDEALKGIDIILKMHGCIKLPYKAKLLDCYSEHGITLSFDHTSQNYSIWNLHSDVSSKKFKTLREAMYDFEYWMHPKHNVGIALRMILNDQGELDGELDHPPITKKIRSLLKTKKYNF